MGKIRNRLGILCALAVWPMQTTAFSSCAVDAMVVFDGSGSMAEVGFNLLDTPRITDARQAMRKAMPRITPYRRVGLLVYGPNGTPGDGPGEHVSQSIGCRSIDVRFEPTSNAADRIITEIDQLTPAGSTPLTAAVAQAAETLNYRTWPGVVVLVTDGKETCGGVPCDLATALAQDAADLTVHVIGFKVRSDYFDWESGEGADHVAAPVIARCLADETGGTYTATENVDQLVDALNATLGCAVVGRLDRVTIPPA